MAEINDPSQERPSLPRVIDEQVESQRLEAIAREHPEPQALAEAIAEERAPDVADVLEDRPDSAVEVVAGRVDCLAGLVFNWLVFCFAGTELAERSVGVFSASLFISSGSSIFVAILLACSLLSSSSVASLPVATST